MNAKIIYSFVRIVFISIMVMMLFGCNNKEKPDRLFYERAFILDIKRDDESQYHLLVRYPDGITESVADARCKIKMSDSYSPFAEMPFVSWETINKRGTLKAWEFNSTAYSGIDIMVYLPMDYKIELFND